MPSPTSRSKKYWQDAGYKVDIVEYWNNFTRRRHDMYGLFDMVAIGNGEVVFIQVTSRTNVSARVRKIAEDKYADIIAACREAGVRLIVEGWGKMASGKYERREVDVS